MQKEVATALVESLSKPVVAAGKGASDFARRYTSRKLVAVLAFFYFASQGVLKGAVLSGAVTVVIAYLGCQAAVEVAHAFSRKIQQAREEEANESKRKETG